MTHEDIIRMAREVADPDTTDPLIGGDIRDLITLNLEEMMRFAALVYEHTWKEAGIAATRTVLDAAVLAERKACEEIVSLCCGSCAEAIRARGQNESR